MGVNCARLEAWCVRRAAGAAAAVTSIGLVTPLKATGPGGGAVYGLGAAASTDRDDADAVRGVADSKPASLGALVRLERPASRFRIHLPIAAITTMTTTPPTVAPTTSPVMEGAGADDAGAGVGVAVPSAATTTALALTSPDRVDESMPACADTTLMAAANTEDAAPLSIALCSADTASAALDAIMAASSTATVGAVEASTDAPGLAADAPVAVVVTEVAARVQATGGTYTPMMICMVGRVQGTSRGRGPGTSRLDRCALTRMPVPPADAAGTFCCSRSGPLEHVVSMEASAVSCSSRRKERPLPMADELCMGAGEVAGDAAPGRVVGRLLGVGDGRVPSTLPLLACELAAEVDAKRVTSPVTSFTTAMR